MTQDAQEKNKIYKGGDELVVVPEKLTYEGAAIAKVDGYTIFVDGACPEDKLKIKLQKANKNYATAQILEILEPSQYRVKPFCPLHNACGGCGWQFIDYEYQLKQKQNIVKETIKKITGEDIEVRNVLPSPKIREFRSKVQYPVSQTKVSKRLIAGYYKKNSHELM